MKEKITKQWVDSFDEKELKELMNYKYKDFPIKNDLKQKIVKMINEEGQPEKKAEDTAFYKPGLKFAFSFAAVVMIFVSSLFYFFYGDPFKNQSKATFASGETFLIAPKSGEKKAIKSNDKLKESSKIIVGKNSTLDITIGDKSNVQVKENSRIELAILYKDLTKERTRINLELGELIARPEKIRKGSSFIIGTEVLSVGAKGTIFNVAVDEDKNNKVDVVEGRVFLKLNINSANLSMAKKELNDKINNVLNEEIILNINEKINVSYTELMEIQKNIVSVLNEIKSKENILSSLEIENKLQGIRDLKNGIVKVEINKDNAESAKSSAEKNKRLFSTKKIGNLNVGFFEKNTAVNSDGRIIYIASDSNKAVYSVYPDTGKLRWKFQDPDLSKITSPAFVFQDKIVISSPTSIIVLNDRGSIILKEKLSKGTSYWAIPAVINNKLYIPTSSTVYVYDGAKLGKLENFPESMGQVYLAEYKNNLLLSYSNEQELKLYDTATKQVIWSSAKLKQRAFMTPFIYADNFIIIDNKNLVYKFNQEKPEGIYFQINTGVISNIIRNNSYLYFIGNNGIFYKLSENLNAIKSIEKIDNKPETDNYLTKKILISGNDIYICSDSGKLFDYNLKDNQYKFIEISENKGKKPLISSPVKAGSKIIVVDTDSNLYTVEKN